MRIYICLITLLIFIILNVMDYIPLYFTYYLIIINVVTFVVYAIDKSNAKHERWRTKERTLHLYSLFGGWFGAIVGQQFLRHKSVKTSFLITFRLTILLNVSAMYCLHFIINGCELCQ